MSLATHTRAAKSDTTRHEDGMATAQRAACTSTSTRSAKLTRWQQCTRPQQPAIDADTHPGAHARTSDIRGCRLYDVHRVLDSRAHQLEQSAAQQREQPEVEDGFWQRRHRVPSPAHAPERAPHACAAEGALRRLAFPCQDSREARGEERERRHTRPHKRDTPHTVTAR